MNFEQHIVKIREDYYNFLNKYVKKIFYNHLYNYMDFKRWLLERFNPKNICKDLYQEFIVLVENNLDEFKDEHCLSYDEDDSIEDLCNNYINEILQELLDDFDDDSGFRPKYTAVVDSQQATEIENSCNKRVAYMSGYNIKQSFLGDYLPHYRLLDNDFYYLTVYCKDRDDLNPSESAIYFKFDEVEDNMFCVVYNTSSSLALELSDIEFEDEDDEDDEDEEYDDRLFSDEDENEEVEDIKEIFIDKKFLTPEAA